MDRRLFILANDVVRQRVIEAVRKAPEGYRVTIQEPRRSGDQNARLWAMLTDLSEQATLGGAQYDPEDWKCIMMAQLGHESKFLPRLEGAGYTPVGFRSSQLSKREMSDLMELIAAWGAQHGVQFGDERKAAA